MVKQIFSSSTTKQEQQFVSVLTVAVSLFAAVSVKVNRTISLQFFYTTDIEVIGKAVGLLNENFAVHNINNVADRQHSKLSVTLVRRALSFHVKHFSKTKYVSCHVTLRS